MLPGRLAKQVSCFVQICLSDTHRSTAGAPNEVRGKVEDKGSSDERCLALCRHLWLDGKKMFNYIPQSLTAYYKKKINKQRTKSGRTLT